MRYEVKPDNIDAVLFDGTNFDEVVDLLNPHIAKARDFRDRIDYQVFDVASMQWLDVLEGYYVILSPDESVTVMKKAEFEEKYQPAKPVDFGKWHPQPTPMPYWPDRIGDPYPTLPRPIVTYESHTDGRPHVTV